jgi:predicted nucleic acid-binding protein
MPAKASPRSVVIDANGIVEGAWWLDSPEWQVLLYRARAGAIRLIVPEVVVREVVGRFNVVLRREAAAVVLANKRLQRLTHDDPAQEAAAFDFEAKVGEYGTFLRSTLDRNRAVVPPLPEIDVSDLVDRAVQRRRPFDENGSGFRDSLLWETIVNELRDKADCCRQDWMRTDRHHSPRTLRRICMLTRSDAG